MSLERKRVDTEILSASTHAYYWMVTMSSESFLYRVKFFRLSLFTLKSPSVVNVNQLKDYLSPR